MKTLTSRTDAQLVCIKCQITENKDNKTYIYHQKKGSHKED